MERLTEQELEQMTDAERAGYEELLAEEENASENPDLDSEDDDETVDDDTDSDDDTAEDDESDNDTADEDEDNDEGDEQDDDADDEDGDEQAEVDDDADTDEDDENIDDNESDGAIDFTAPARIKEEIEAVEQRQAELLEQFDDGELTRQEYAEKQAELNKELRERAREQARAEFEIQQAQERYRNDVAGFLKEHPEYSRSEWLTQKLDEEVRALQLKSSNPLDVKLVEKAHERIKAELDKAQSALNSKNSKADENKSSEKKQAKTKTVNKKTKRELPPNLNAVPSADVNDAADDNGHFAYLSRLAQSDPLEYERRLAAMKPAEYDAFLQFGG